MTLLLNTWTDAVAKTLANRAFAAEQRSPRRWSFAATDARETAIEAWITPEWLQLDAPLPPNLTPADLGFEVFRVNAWLSAGWRLCTVAGDPRLRLRADVPLLEDTPLGQRLERLCIGIAFVESWLATRANGAATAPVVPAATSPSIDDDLQHVCRETDWPFTARDGGAVMVELEVPGVFQQATLERRRGGGVAISVPVLAEVPPAPVCAGAVVRFMLALTGAMRMVSARGRQDDGGVDFCICFDEEAPAADELAHAFAALSVAWRCGGREAAVLAQDERIARLYAGTFGDPSRDEVEVQNKHSA